MMIAHREDGDLLNEKRHVLSIDLETYSDIDLSTCGVYRYVEGDFHILLFAYAFDDEDVHVVDLACGEELPQDVRDAVFDPAIIKAAWNAQFERTCLSQFFGTRLSPDSWQCSMVWAASLSLPLKLKTAAEVLKNGEQKDDAGERLIKYFSVPCRPTKSNGGRTRNLPEHAPEDWERFKSYCKQDVRTERDIRHKLEALLLKESEWDFYHMDQRINDRGVLIDKVLVEQAITCDLILSEEMSRKAYELTGLENPNSVSQLKGWLEERGIAIDSLGKKDVAAMIREIDKNGLDQEALDMLKLRLQMAKSSVKKYQAADRYICKDGRAHGLFQFSGANRTQRWAGRGIQLQNLPQNHISTLDEARDLVKMGCFDMVESIYGKGSKFTVTLPQRVVKNEMLGDFKKRTAKAGEAAAQIQYKESFRAPEAKILVVDDTPINLIVVKELLKQTLIQVDEAKSGAECLEKVTKDRYDLILLDYRMPVMDGIETRKKLSQLPGNLNKDTPVVALTANAISGARERFLKDGFDNYMTKPIDAVKLEEMLLEYLPDYKILGPGAVQPESAAAGEDDIIPQFVRDIAEIDIEAGIRNNGDEEAYIETLKTYAGMVGGHIDDIERFMSAGDIENATIKIHALKSTSRIIGAADIGELAQKLETAGKENDTETLNNELGGLLERCRKLGEQLSPLLDKPEEAEDESLPLISEEELHEAYALIKEANESFRLENVNEIAESLKGYRIPDAEKERVRNIIKAVSDLEYDKLPEIIG